MTARNFEADIIVRATLDAADADTAFEQLRAWITGAPAALSLTTLAVNGNELDLATWESTGERLLQAEFFVDESGA
jgi:hypothetical protein